MRERWNESYTNIRIILTVIRVLLLSPLSIITIQTQRKWKKIHNQKREVQRLLQSSSEQRVLFCYNNISAGHTNLLQVHRCYWICGRKLENVQHARSYCTFHKHANSKVQNLPSQLRFWLPSIIITITINKPWNTETQKHTRRIKIHQSQITNHDLLNPLKKSSVS